jgi:nucleotide-binding universal stress UspA family protein
MYDKILVPVDGSETSTRGLNEAIRLAKINGGQLRLMNIVNEYILDATYSTGLFPDNLIAALCKEGKAILDAAQAIAQSAGVKADTVMIESIGGVPADFIIAQAKEWNADIIVMGTHGRRGLLRLALGSNADLVVRAATMPVLLVHATPKKTSKPEFTIRPEATAA